MPDATDSSSLPLAARMRSLAAASIGALAVGLTVGLVIPLLSLVLERRGVADGVIGLNAATSALATLACGPFLAPLIARLGAAGAQAIGVAGSVTAVLLFPWLTGLGAWFGLRFLLGASLTLHWVASESWITAVAGDRLRGRAVAVYATLWSGGIAAGPQLLQLTGTEDATPFLLAAGLLVMALVPLLLARGTVPPLPAPAGGLRAWPWREGGLGFLGGFTTGYAETAVLALLPVYGMGQGYDRATAVLLLSCFAIGGLALQLMLGPLADWLDRGRLLAAIAAGAVAVTAAVPAAAGTVLIWPAWFLLGGLISGCYSIGLVLIGERVGLAQRGAANVGLIMAYQAGSLAGPALSGQAMDRLDHGLPLALLPCFALLLAGALAGGRRRGMA